VGIGSERNVRSRFRERRKQQASTHVRSEHRSARGQTSYEHAVWSDQLVGNGLREKAWKEFDARCLNARLGEACTLENGSMCFSGCTGCDGFVGVESNAVCQDGYWQGFVNTACSCGPLSCQ